MVPGNKAAMSFKSRLILLTSVWFLLASALIAFTYDWQRKTTELRTKQSLHKELASHMRDDNPLMIGTDYNPVALKSIFHTLMLIGPDFEIYFLDSQGNITSHAAPEGAELMDKVDTAPIQRFLINEPFPILGDDPRHREQKKVFSVAAITELGSTIGYLYVVIGSSRHTDIANSQLDTPYLALASLILLSILGFSLLAYWLVKRSLLLPMERVTRNLQEQAEQDFRLTPDFTHQVPELVPIAEQYQLMAKRIQQQFLQLEYQSSAQRESLMTLSHDLKTPLSSVLGYLETWRLQSSTPDPLIDIAFNNSVKLSAQLQSLLEAAKQQPALPVYQYESVNLSKVLHTCKQTIQVELNRRALTLYMDTNREIWTIGDESLLERMLLNLLENAIRHSPFGGQIIATVLENTEGRRIVFSLVNSIEPQAKNGSLGIGTKIVKSILMLHHSYLETDISNERCIQRFELEALNV